MADSVSVMNILSSGFLIFQRSVDHPKAMGIRVHVRKPEFPVFHELADMFVYSMDTHAHEHTLSIPNAPMQQQWCMWLHPMRIRFHEHIANNPNDRCMQQLYMYGYLIDIHSHEHI